MPQYHKSLNNMVKKWEKLGLVAKPGPSDGPFPAFFAVEEDRVLPGPSTADVPAPSLEGAVGR